MRVTKIGDHDTLGLKGACRYQDQRFFGTYFSGKCLDLWRDYPNYKIRHNNNLFPLFLHKPMMYPKGEKFQYNNSGFVLLAAIIERMTGQPFDQYLHSHIFDVCGMTSTGYYELDRLPAKCADHYIYCEDTDSYRTNIFCVDAKGTGAGGAYITVPDIVRFWEALLGGKLISTELVSQLMSKQSGDGEDPEEGYYGYGLWIIDNPNGKDRAYFQGCDPGSVLFLSMTRTAASFLHWSAIMETMSGRKCGKSGICCIDRKSRNLSRLFFRNR